MEVSPSWATLQAGSRDSGNSRFIQRSLVTNCTFNLFLTGLVSGFKHIAFLSEKILQYMLGVGPAPARKNK